MSIASLKKAFIAVSILATTVPGLAQAHGGGGAIDPNGDNPSATILAGVNCSGGTDFLAAHIRDDSGFVPGLFLSLHLQKGQKMTSVTDTVSGDNFASAEAHLAGGDGHYYMSLTKTAAGTRNFDVTWHCMNNQGDHTDTEIGVYQVQ